MTKERFYALEKVEQIPIYIAELKDQDISNRVKSLDFISNIDGVYYATGHIYNTSRFSKGSYVINDDCARWSLDVKKSTIRIKYHNDLDKIIKQKEEEEQRQHEENLLFESFYALEKVEQIPIYIAELKDQDISNRVKSLDFISNIDGVYYATGHIYNTSRLATADYCIKDESARSLDVKKSTIRIKYHNKI